MTDKGFSTVVKEKLVLPLEFMKLRKEAIFYPFLATSMFIGTVGQAMNPAGNPGLAIFMATVGLMVVSAYTSKESWLSKIGPLP
jgi:hypothetical protein